MASVLRLARAVRDGARTVLAYGRIADRAGDVRGSGAARIAASYFSSSTGGGGGGGSGAAGAGIPGVPFYLNYSTGSGVSGAAVIRGYVSSAELFESPGRPITTHIGPMGPDGLPDYVDWGKAGGVTPAKDQGRSGHCWAFATAAAVETVLFICTKEIVEVSVQQLVDVQCITTVACMGGSVGKALNYIKANGGIVSAEHYPYTGVAGRIKPVKAPGVGITGYSSFYNVSEASLKRLVAAGPVIASIGADASFMTHMDIGDLDNVLDGPNYTIAEMLHYKISHAVVVVAYGWNFQGEKCWMIKNSHEGGGFILLARDTGKVGGAFGITRAVKVIDKCYLSASVTVDPAIEMS